ncbi:Subtilase family protein, putative [Theobroma cacao]|uniref:Subtilase family protein, putative n=1 Tax=Theobroma cacao TaxID=3641 RepID=A0A061GGN5_THECC|nr:Subtilase family protein, putative [Theobroma cacao]
MIMWFPKLSLFLLSFGICCSLFQAPAFAIKKSYIVYLGSHVHGPEVTDADLDRVTDSHYNLLGSFLGSKEKAREAIFDSYQRHINGFAATLEEEEAAEIAKHPEVVSVFHNRQSKLQTTHSWELMSLEWNGEVIPGSLWTEGRFGEDTIIANLDTVVFQKTKYILICNMERNKAFGPDQKAFATKGLDLFRPGGKVNVSLTLRLGFACNRKLIGARYFNKGFISNGGGVNSSQLNALDEDGHGTHTLSTAGGNFVPGATVLGVDYGTAKGGSPKARVAAYKVCWGPKNKCFDSDVLAAFDMAIHDGVDVISVSLASKDVGSGYFDDVRAIGAFHAVKHGITVVFAAGNTAREGAGSVRNFAPWMITVAASTLDRKFKDYVELENGLHLEGISLSKPLPERRLYPLITGAEGMVANGSSDVGLLCLEDLDPNKVKGKIVVCLEGGYVFPVMKGLLVAEAGAAGMIMCNHERSPNETSFEELHFLPVSHLNYEDCRSLYAYINSSDNPMAYFTPPTTQLYTKPAPLMAVSSSRGPNPFTPEILKPDITAPGVDIIAANTEAVSPTGFPEDTRRSAFLFKSGTSMSCPHVAGVAGLLKTLKPDWSPAAIRSAIMTTAETRDNTGNALRDDLSLNKSTPFGYGSGHIKPNRAMNPGLVYDLRVEDYLDFLCAIGYNQSMVERFSEGPYTCPESGNPLDLNYPSIAVPKLSGSVTISRKLKNVGTPGNYTARVCEPFGISVSVEPSSLQFENIGEEKGFKLTLKAKGDGAANKDYVFGALTWTDGKHYVRSPIAVAAAAST